MPQQNKSLKGFIYRTLVKRIIATTLLISGVFAIASFYHSKGMINNAIIQVSAVKISIIKGRFRELMRQPGISMEAALSDAINYPPNTELHINEGEFVYAVLHNQRQKKISVYRHQSLEGVDEVVKYLATVDNSQPFRKQIYKSIEIYGKPFLEIHTKLLDGQDGSEIFLKAFFALSDQAVQSIRLLTIKIGLYVIAIVLATVVLLYPVIILLFGKLSQFSSGLLTAHLQTMEALGEAIAKRDNDTSFHNYRVTIYAVSLAEVCRVGGKEMQSIIKGSFLHDVGKIGIRDNILLTRERYNESEFEIMQQHVGHGLDIIKRSSWLNDAAAIVGNHHEKYDGSGYPTGIKGENIPQAARIFAIVDVFDALTSERPYKKPYPYEQTMKIMEEGRLNHFDPDLLDNFTDISKKLHDEFAGREDDGLIHHLQRITDKYFHSGINTLKY